MPLPSSVAGYRFKFVLSSRPSLIYQCNIMSPKRLRPTALIQYAGNRRSKSIGRALQPFLGSQVRSLNHFDSLRRREAEKAFV
jgi:hypothetical protein